MYYSIKGYCPYAGVSMGRHGLVIDLHPQFKAMVLASGITQDQVDHFIESDGLRWLDECGYTSVFDPDNCGMDKDEKLPPGPNATRMYGLEKLRVSWGEWGPEHITVPGNACGLDIDRSSFCPFDGMSLVPHNIDCWDQKNLLMIVFTELAEKTMWAAFGNGFVS